MPPKPRAENSRRDLLRKAAYLTPLVVTLPVMPSFASAGSRSIGGGHDNGRGGSGGDGQSDNKRRRRGKSRGPGKK